MAEPLLVRVLTNERIACLAADRAYDTDAPSAPHSAPRAKSGHPAQGQSVGRSFSSASDMPFRCAPPNDLARVTNATTPLALW